MGFFNGVAGSNECILLYIIGLQCSKTRLAKAPFTHRPANKIPCNRKLGLFLNKMIG